MSEPITSLFKTILNDAVGFIAANLRQMATLCLPILFFATVVGAGMSRIHQSNFNAFFVPFVLNLIVYPIYTAALIHLMVARAGQAQPSNGQLLLMAGKQWAPLFILKLVTVLMIFAGSMLIIPGLWLWVRLSFAEFYLVVFGYKPFAAIQKSLTATKPYSMLLFAILMLSYIPILILDLLVDRAIWSLTHNPWLSLVSSTVFSFIGLFVLVVVFRVFMESDKNEPVPAAQPSV